MRDVIIFYTKSPDWHLKHEIDKHFLCENFQLYNHIPGHEIIARKDEFLIALKKFEAPCFEKWKFYPEALNLDEERMQSIF